MGATAAIGTLVNQGTAMQPDQHVLGSNRLLCQVGPRSTILGGLGGIGPLKTGRFLWFRDRQFLFTHSPFTKE